VTWLDLKIFAVHHSHGHIRQALTQCIVFSKRQDRGCNISGQHLPRIPYPSSRGQRLPAGPSGDIQDAPTLPDAGEVEHYYGRRSQPILDRRRPTIPRIRSGLPLLRRGLLVPEGVERSRRHRDLLGLLDPALDLLKVDTSEHIRVVGTHVRSDRSDYLLVTRTLGDDSRIRT